MHKAKEGKNRQENGGCRSQRKRAKRTKPIGENCVCSYEQGVNVKEKEAKDRGRESFNGGGDEGEPERDRSKGFGKMEVCGF